MKKGLAAVGCVCVLAALQAAHADRSSTSAPSLDPSKQPTVEEPWRTFEGTWTATGRRQTIPTETGREAAAVEFSGSLVLTITDGLSRGFRAIVIGFDDGASGAVGRSLWTDERGDRIYSTIQSEPIETGKQFTGTITGGTGRYAGVNGTYAFTWQYVLSAQDGTVQGRTAALKGRYRKRAGAP
jgi:hypothetical protein